MHVTILGAHERNVDPQAPKNMMLEKNGRTPNDGAEPGQFLCEEGRHGVQHLFGSQLGMAMYGRIEMPFGHWVPLSGLLTVCCQFKIWAIELMESMVV